VVIGGVDMRVNKIMWKKMYMQLDQVQRRGEMWTRGGWWEELWEDWHGINGTVSGASSIGKPHV
jgi:hypothetical protein